MEEVIANLVEAAPDVFISDLGRIHVHRQRVPILVDHPIRLRVFLAVADGCQQIIRIIQTAVEKGGGELLMILLGRHISHAVGPRVRAGLLILIERLGDVHNVRRLRPHRRNETGQKGGGLIAILGDLVGLLGTAHLLVSGGAGEEPVGPALSVDRCIHGCEVSRILVRGDGVVEHLLIVVGHRFSEATGRGLIVGDLTDEIRQGPVGEERPVVVRRRPIIRFHFPRADGTLRIRRPRGFDDAVRVVRERFRHEVPRPIRQGHGLLAAPNAVENP